MPNDRQQQLDALKRNMCGDCGVGPFKGGAHRNGTRVSRSAAWVLLFIVLLTAGTLVYLAL